MQEITKTQLNQQIKLSLCSQSLSSGSVKICFSFRHTERLKKIRKEKTEKRQEGKRSWAVLLQLTDRSWLTRTSSMNLETLSARCASADLRSKVKIYLSHIYLFDMSVTHKATRKRINEGERDRTKLTKIKKCQDIPSRYSMFAQYIVY